MLYTLDLHNAVYQLYLSKTGKKKPDPQADMHVL